MTPWVRYLVGGVLGVTVGLGAAVATVHSGTRALGTAIGPWRSGSDFGSADQSVKTRAIIAVRALLALPAREARYYMADTDDEGHALDGRCTYRIVGGPLPARWWSLTVYDINGYLAGPGPWSVESAAVPFAERGAWSVIVSPKQRVGHWLPTAGLDRFNLTLRTYLPANDGKTTPARAALPSILKETCA